MNERLFVIHNFKISNSGKSYKGYFTPDNDMIQRRNMPDLSET